MKFEYLKTKQKGKNLIVFKASLAFIEKFVSFNKSEVFKFSKRKKRDFISNKEFLEFLESKSEEDRNVESRVKLYNLEDFLRQAKKSFQDDLDFNFEYLINCKVKTGKVEFENELVKFSEDITFELENHFTQICALTFLEDSQKENFEVLIGFRI